MTKWRLHEDGLFLACDGDGPQQWIEEALEFLRGNPAKEQAPDLLARMQVHLDRANDYGRVDSYLQAGWKQTGMPIDLVWEQIDDRGRGLFEEVTKVLEQHGPSWLAFGKDDNEDWGWWPMEPLEEGDL